MKASELKRGMIIREGGDLLVVVEVEHRTPGNLRAIYQTTLKNIINGKLVNRRFSPTDTVEKADLESKKVQYLYRDHAGFHFMDMTSYETIVLDDQMIGQSKDYLKENLEVEVLYYEHRPVAIELPVSVALRITESAPGAKGDTSGRAMKPATLETGLVINVPLFIEEGETVLVDTRSGDYIGRA
ncbi:MAG: elongation factor P [Candidatus Omnitrophica bacterium]|nr:elongation factor P [Candidatus Omnitrophota bacterium]MCM8790343.1 elongation factor P [Candidatus Omnitrophota bacterium]